VTAIEGNGEGTLVSVVIPTYNRPNATNRALSSAGEAIAALPGAPDCEILVVDDASANAWRPGADVTLPANARLDIIRHAANRGAAAARNSGVEAASGRYIAFLDSDDAWLPEKLLRQTEAAKAAESGGNPVWAITCGARMSGRVNTRGDHLPDGAEDLGEFAKRCWFNPGTTLLLPRAVFSSIGPFREDLPRLEDYEWFLRFGLAGGRLDAVPEILAEIHVERRDTVAAIERARALLLRQLRGDERLSGVEATMRAYLAIESASAHYYSGRYFGFARELARSFWHRPRMKLLLR
jgi:glycosyltransferase involved in cell wall biosynthesis